jgi:hydroxyethylthiazole kinase-like uncharacterized protein yjeF
MAGRSAVAGPIPAGAHKGTRGKVAVVGGAPGMAGAAILACDAALRSGAGMVRAVVAPESLPAVQGVLPTAMAATWPTDGGALASSVVDWADAVVLGPGLGASPAAAALVDRVLAAWRGPTVLDADALNHFAGRPAALAAALGVRPALLTPHPVEFARLAAMTPRGGAGRPLRRGPGVRRARRRRGAAQGGADGRVGRARRDGRGVGHPGARHGGQRRRVRAA